MEEISNIKNKDLGAKKLGQRVLILTDIPPCKNYTGGIMLSQMIRFLLEEKIEVDCFCVMNDFLDPKFDMSVMNDINFIKYSRPEENFNISTDSKRKYYSSIRKLIKRFSKYVNENPITKILCIIQGEVIVDMVNSIKENTNMDYTVQIWDPIDWWIKEHKFDEYRKNKVLDGYDKAISNASCCITTSFVMRSEYSKKYNIKCIEVMVPLEKKNFEIDLASKNKSEFVIAISGQIYAKEETNILFQALEKMDWKYNGKKIIFKYYGNWSQKYINLKKYSKRKDNIIISGFLPQNKLLKELSCADLLYCPYFFSNNEALKRVTILSFPSKLITYMSLKVPIMLHAPEYAGPNIFLNQKNAAFLVNSMNVEEVVKAVKNIITSKDTELRKITNDANKLFDDNFTFEVVKGNFFKALDLKYSKIKKLKILEVNNVDLPGRRFNGFDLQRMINNDTIHNAKQIVTYKTSSDKEVVKFYPTDKALENEWKLNNNEFEILSVHSQLSLTSSILRDNDEFIHSDVVHYHLIHNTKLSLWKMIDLCETKPAVLTIHDPWNFTGRCVYPQECEKWKTGCHNCKHLDNLFPFKEDNCNSMWKLKEKIYKKLDIDIVVTTPFMVNMIKDSPLTRHFKNVHLIPFGIDLNKFSNSISKQDARKKLKINQDDIVLFFRAQMAMKGTEFIVEALNQLNTDKKVTLLTCSEVGLLGELEDKYTVIDLGHIEDDQMIVAYNACDVFLMPSRGESFGLMAIEAMACSRPIVIFDNSALPYVTFAPECGVLVKNKDSFDLMKAIKRLIDDKDERERRGNLGRKLALENYDIKLYHERILKLYEYAYNRQKNKKIIVNCDRKINYDSSAVQALIRKLDKIFHNIFPGYKLNSEFMKHKKNISKKSEDIKIDYSSDDVQDVIEQFNDCIYQVQNLENLVEAKNQKIKNMPLLIKGVYLLVNDRPKLKGTIKHRTEKYPVIYKFLKSIYGSLRLVKKAISGKNKKKSNFLI